MLHDLYTFHTWLFSYKPSYSYRRSVIIYTMIWMYCYVITLLVCYIRFHKYLRFIFTQKRLILFSPKVFICPPKRLISPPKRLFSPQKRLFCNPKRLISPPKRLFSPSKRLICTNRLNCPLKRFNRTPKRFNTVPNRVILCWKLCRLSKRVFVNFAAFRSLKYFSKAFKTFSLQ